MRSPRSRVIPVPTDAPELPPEIVTLGAELGAVADALTVIAGRFVKSRTVEQEDARIAAWDRLWRRSKDLNHPGSQR